MPHTEGLANIAAIRALLTDAFTAEELRRFCHDRPLFHPIIDEFGPEQGLAGMVEEVITYCEKHPLFDQLLDEMQRYSPAQYERHGPYRYEAGQQAPAPPLTPVGGRDQEHVVYFVEGVDLDDLDRAAEAGMPAGLGRLIQGLAESGEAVQIALPDEHAEHILRFLHQDVSYFQSGKSRQQQGDHRQAIADFTAAIEINPGQAEYFYWRGLSYHTMSAYERAIDDLSRAIKLDRHKAEYFYSRGLSYHALADLARATEQEDRGDYKRAVADLDKAIELDPVNAGYYCQRGRSWWSQGQYKRAVADHTRAIAMDPGNAGYYWERGRSYEAGGDLGRAEDDFTNAIELDPDEAGYYHARGVVRRASNDPQAAADLDRARALGYKD